MENCIVLIAYFLGLYWWVVISVYLLSLLVAHLSDAPPEDD